MNYQGEKGEISILTPFPKVVNMNETVGPIQNIHRSRESKEHVHPGKTRYVSAGPGEGQSVGGEKVHQPGGHGSWKYHGHRVIGKH